MKTAEYKTLLYLQDLGLDPNYLISSGDFRDVKRLISSLSDYELMFYHCKILKMPKDSFIKAGLIMAMFHNAVSEYEQREEDRAEVERLEALSEARSRAKQEEQARAQAEKLATFNRVLNICFWFGVFYLVFALGAVFACFMLG